MRIAVCIKNKELRGRFYPLLDRYGARQGVSLECRFFETDFDLVNSLTGGNYDAVILDASQNIARLIAEIREKDQRVRLIPVATAQWTEAEYGSDIWYCLPSLLSDGLLYTLLNRLDAELKQDTDMGLVIKSRQGIVHIRFSDLECVEVINKIIRFYLGSGATVEVTAPLSEYEGPLLNWPDFFKVHRSYIVNLRYVQKLESGSIVTRSGRSVPVSKHLYTDLRKDYLCRLSDPGMVQPAEPVPVPLEKPAGYRILLVDDDGEETAYRSNLLQQKGCQVVTANSAKTGEQAAADGPYDCVLLDVMLGADRGFDVCASLAQLTGAPVIFLSTRADLDSQLQGFQVGGADYITKDTKDELFWAKIEARIGRTASKRTLRFGPLHIDPAQRRVELESEILTLTAVEFDLLWMLAQRAGKVCTPEEIYRNLWDGSHSGGSQSIQMQMSRLRRKLEKACPDHNFIETVWGEGYRFASFDHE